MFPTSSFDPETLGVLTGVFEDAWIDIQGMLALRRSIPKASGQLWPGASWLPMREASAILGDLGN